MKKQLRLRALVTAGAVLALSACNGATIDTGAAATTSANVRIVNGVAGAPGVGNIDVYYQVAGTSSPSSALVGNLAFGTASDYAAPNAGSATVIVERAGSAAPGGGGSALVSCPIPGTSIGVNYSIVVVYASNAVNCELFQDVAYTASGQYRAHDAAPKAFTSVAGFGTLQASAAPPGATFAATVPAAQGNLAAGGSAIAAFTQAQPNLLPPVANGLSFAVGAQPTGSGPALATLDLHSIFSPGGTTQPNTTGAATVSGTLGISVFALDCTAGVASSVPCTNGVVLVGFTDRL